MQEGSGEGFAKIPMGRVSRAAAEFLPRGETECTEQYVERFVKYGLVNWGSKGKWPGELGTRLRGNRRGNRAPPVGE